MTRMRLAFIGWYQKSISSLYAWTNQYESANLSIDGHTYGWVVRESYQFTFNINQLAIGEQP